MEFRSEPRLPANEPVRVTVLNEPETQFLGHLINRSDRGVGIHADQPVPYGAAVKLEWDNTLLLGEVCYCRPQEGGFAIGLEVEHALFNTLELARLSKRLLEEEQPR
jgi:PilZ domain